MKQNLIAAGPAERIWPAQVAGQFYPGSQAELKRVVTGFLETAPKTELGGALKALVVPHAGYQYSGQVAAFGYRELRPEIRRVIIIASNHARGVGYFKFAVSDATHFETPLGRVKVSRLVDQLKRDSSFKVVNDAFTAHVVEVQLPFLQHLLADFEILPIITGNVSTADLSHLAVLLAPYLDPQTPLVVSSDLSHYHPYAEAVRLDREAISVFEKLDQQHAAAAEACGLDGVLMLLELAREHGWQGRILEYKNSGDVSGDKSRVVGYSAIAFFAPALSSGDKRTLLELSRSTLESAVRTGVKPVLDSEVLSERLRARQGCFVTITKHGELRGCIGHLFPEEPLFESVIESTISAAASDPRFEPVRAEELNSLKLELTLLSAPRVLPRETPAQLLDFLVPGVHGVILRRRAHQATYLPQVWEKFTEKETFLESLCRKAGLSKDAWKDPETEVLVYEGEKLIEGSL